MTRKAQKREWNFQKRWGTLDGLKRFKNERITEQQNEKIAKLGKIMNFPFMLLTELFKKKMKMKNSNFKKRGTKNEGLGYFYLILRTRNDQNQVGMKL